MKKHFVALFISRLLFVAGFVLVSIMAQNPSLLEAWITEDTGFILALSTMTVGGVCVIFLIHRLVKILEKRHEEMMDRLKELEKRSEKPDR